MSTLGYIFSLIAYPILINKFGLRAVGEIFTIQAVVLIAASIANYSFAYYIPIVSKRVTDDEKYVVKLWNLVLHIRTFFSILFGLILTVGVYYFYKESFLILAFSLPLLLSKIINPVLFCNALEINKYVFKIGFFSKLLFLLLILVTTRSYLVNFFLALSELVVILFYLKRIHIGLYSLRLISFYEIKQFLRQTFNLFLVNTLLVLKPNAILPAVSLLLGFEFAALFLLAQKIINIIKSTSATVFISFFPIYSKDDFSLNIISTKRIVIALFTSLLIVLAFWILSPYFIYYLNDFNNSLPATKTLQIMSLSIPVFFMIIPLFSYLLKHRKWAAILTFSIVQLLVLITTLYLFIDQNIVGVAKSLVISEYTLLICYTIYILKQKRLKANIKSSSLL